MNNFKALLILKMKSKKETRFLTFTLIISFLSNVVAQNYPGNAPYTNMTINTNVPSNGGSNADCAARDQIIVSPTVAGTIISPESKLYIDQNIQVPATYSTSSNFGFENLTPNTNLSLDVGTIKGYSNVSQLGAANYSIPIELPIGSGGATPELTISYNSDSRQGCMGMGWSISGLQNISRVEQSLNNNNFVKGISKTNLDGFAFNGDILIPQSENLNGLDGTEYHTKMESFAKIISHTSNNLNGPEWFEILTKEGVTIEFGKTPNSKIKPNGSVTSLVWYINKVTDKNGNYWTYDYILKNGNDIELKCIKYSGNDAMNPIIVPTNEINFYYDISENPSFSSVAGERINKSSLLRKIEILVEGNQYSSFNFSYNKFQGVDYLVKMETINSTGEKLNPLIMQYEENNDQYNVVNAGNIDSYNNYFVVSDINNDGRSDLLKKGYSDAPTNGIECYKADQNGLNLANAPITLGLSNYLGDFYFNHGTQTSSGYVMNGADFNGDGVDDLLYVQISEVSMYLTPAIVNNNSINFLAYPKAYVFSTTDGNGASVIPNNLGIRLLDFNGDGKTDIFVGYGQDDENHVIRDIWLDYTAISTPYQLNGLFPENVDFSRCSVSKSDSRLKSDLMNISSIDMGNGNPVTFYGLKYNSLTDNFETYTLPSFMNDNYIFQDCRTPWMYPIPGTCMGPVINSNNNLALFSDYNGDGFTDLIFENIIYYGDGLNGFNNGGTLNCEYIYTNPSTSFCTTNNFMVADINADGKADVIEFTYFLNQAKTGIKINYSASDLSTYYEIPYHFDNGNYEISFADFEGDGQVELYWYKRFQTNTPLYFLNFNHNQRNKKLVTLFDGLVNKTEFIYSFVNRDELRTSNTETALLQYNYPNVSKAITKAVVKTQKQSNGIGGEFLTDYRYDNPVTNLLGEGLLGFQKFGIKNVNTTTEILTENQLNANLAILYPLSEKVYNFSIPNKISTTLYSGNLFEPIFSNGNRTTYLLKQSEIKKTNHLANYMVTTSNSIDNFGNLGYTMTTIGLGLPYSETTITYENDPAKINTVPYLPKTVTRKNTLNGESNLNLTEYTYNLNHLLENSVKNANNNDKKVINNYTYFQNGLIQKSVLQATNALTSEVNFEYDPLYKYQKHVINPLNQLSTLHKHATFNAIDSYTDEAHQTTSTVIDGWGRQESIIYPNSNVSNIAYMWVNYSDFNSNHPLNLSHVKSKRVINTEGRPSQENYYDNLGRIILTSTENFNGDKIYKATEYNDAGLVYKETNNYQLDNNQSGLLPVIKTYIYDTYNRITDIYEDDGSGTPRHTEFTYSFANGNSTTSIIFPDGSHKSVKIDAAGRKIEANDDFGTIQFQYSCNTANNTNTKTTNQGISTIFDEIGNPIELTEPAGITNYIYNGLGQMLSKTDPKNSNYTYTYDLLNRINTVNGPEGTYTYHYYSSGDGLNQIENILGPNNTSTEYTYFPNQKIKSIKENQPSKSFITAYEYDNFDNVTKITYPGGFEIDQIYNSFGYLEQIKRSDDQTLIWQGNSQIPSGKINNFTLGNNKTTNKIYSNYGLPVSQETIGVEHQLTTFDNLSGNLTSRSNLIQNYSENFTYNLNRLFAFDHSLAPSLSFNSPSNLKGRFDSKYDAGNYYYYANGAVKIIDPTAATVPTLLRLQELTNTPFNKVETISEQINPTDNIQLTINYGPSQQRIKSEWTKNGGAPYRTRYYAINFEQIEKLNVQTGITDNYETSYIYAPTGLCAIFVKENGVKKLNYVYTDYLGSINTIYSAETNNVILDRNYDAWGRERNSTTLGYENSTNCPEWLTRGFEGHEMLNDFALINMNGRVYDPVIGQFLSPDPVLQDENNTLNYNKYIFAFNNPLKYTDPTGMVTEGFDGINEYSEADLRGEKCDPRYLPTIDERRKIAEIEAKMAEREANYEALRDMASKISPASIQFHDEDVQQESQKSDISIETIVRDLNSKPVGYKITGDEISEMNSKLSLASTIVDNIKRINGGLQLNLTWAGRMAIKAAPNLNIPNGTVFHVTPFTLKDGTSVLRITAPGATLYNEPFGVYLNDNTYSRFGSQFFSIFEK